MIFKIFIYLFIYFSINVREANRKFRESNSTAKGADYKSATSPCHLAVTHDLSSLITRWMGNRRIARITTSDDEDEAQPPSRLHSPEMEKQQPRQRRRKKIKLPEEEEEREKETQSGDEEAPQEDAKPIGDAVRVSGKGRGRRSHYEAFEFDGNRYDLVSFLYSCLWRVFYLVGFRVLMVRVWGFLFSFLSCVGGRIGKFENFRKGEGNVSDFYLFIYLFGSWEELGVGRIIARLNLCVLCFFEKE